MPMPMPMLSYRACQFPLEVSLYAARRLAIGHGSLCDGDVPHVETVSGASCEAPTLLAGLLWSAARHLARPGRRGGVIAFQHMQMPAAQAASQGTRR